MHGLVSPTRFFTHCCVYHRQAGFTLANKTSTRIHCQKPSHLASEGSGSGSGAQDIPHPSAILAPLIHSFLCAGADMPHERAALQSHVAAARRRARPRVYPFVCPSAGTLCLLRRRHVTDLSPARVPGCTHTRRPVGRMRPGQSLCVVVAVCRHTFVVDY